MNSLYDYLIKTSVTDVIELTEQIIKIARAAGYTVQEVNTNKPWGAYIRFAASDAERFMTEFFPKLNPDEAKLGISSMELSPKILIVSPSQRLSWQLHNRRAERWRFLTEGAYNKSPTDDEGEVRYARAGEEVQFQREERHRLVGVPEAVVLVAEIWQHLDSDYPSDEDDIVRLADDYSR